MVTLVDSIQNNNVFLEENVNFLTSAIKVVPGVSELNVEKSLLSIIPDPFIENIKIKEVEDRLYVDFDVKFIFNFNITPFKHLIDKYFQLKIEKLISDSKAAVDGVLNRSLFSLANQIPSNSNLSISENVSLGKVIYTFGFSKVTKYGDRFEYSFKARDLQLDAEKVKNGTSYRNPNYLLYRINGRFDTDSFENDFGVENFGLNENTNGKALVIALIEEGNIVGKEWSHSFSDKSPWYGTFSTTTDGNRFSYSQVYYDSRRLSLVSKNIGNKLNIVSNISGLIKFPKAPTLSTLPKTIQTANVPRINVHSYDAVASGVQIFFDIDWNGLLEDNTSQQKLLKVNPELSSMAYISNMRIYRKRIDEKNAKRELLGNGVEQEGLIFCENDKIKIIEKKYNLRVGNENIRSFIFSDKFFTEKRDRGKYEYSIELEIKNDIPLYIKNKKEELSVVEKNIESYTRKFSKKQNDKKSNNIKINEEQYLLDLKTFYDALVPLTNENSLVLNEEIKKTYAFSNPITGISDGVGALSQGVKDLNKIYMDLDSSLRSSIPGKRNNTTDRRNFVVNYTFKKIYSYDETGISFLSEELEKPEEIERSLVNRLFLSDLEQFDITSVQPKKVTFKEKDGINFVERKDVSLLASSKSRKIQTKGFTAEDLKQNEQSQLVSFRDFTLEEGSMLQINPTIVENPYKLDEKFLFTNILQKEEDAVQVDTILNNKIQNIDLFPVFERLAPKQEELPKSKIEYFSGYKTNEQNEVIMKEPIWIQVENTEQIRNLNVLCRFEKIKEDSANLPMLNKYFVIGEVERAKKIEQKESILFEELQEIHTQEKLRVAR